MPSVHAFENKEAYLQPTYLQHCQHPFCVWSKKKNYKNKESISSSSKALATDKSNVLQQTLSQIKMPYGSQSLEL